MRCLICHDEWAPPFTLSTMLTIRQADVCCPRCRVRFPLIEGSVCIRCGRPTGENVCGDCIAWQKRGSVLSKNRSVYMYNDWMKEVMNRFKFRGDYVLIESFRHDVVRVFFTHFSRDVMLVPVPLSEKRLGERAFNQAEAIAALIGLPIVHALERTSDEKQSKKTRRERLFRQQFRLVDVQAVREKRVVIVDDIYTTGSTVNEIAKHLQDGGATVVGSFTLVRS